MAVKKVVGGGRQTAGRVVVGSWWKGLGGVEGFYVVVRGEVGDGDDVGEGWQVTMLASKPPQTTAVNNKERGRGCAWSKNDNPIGVPVDVLVTAGLTGGLTKVVLDDTVGVVCRLLR